VTHPFHPLSGRRLVCVGERYNRYGKRLLLQVDKERICSVPPQWTDVVALEPEVALSAGRSSLRLADLLELAELVECLTAMCPRSERQGNYVASVKLNTPRMAGEIKRDPGVDGTNSAERRARKLDSDHHKRRK